MAGAMVTARRAAEIAPFEVMDVLARAHALERAGRHVVRNAAGSNMHWGVATALLDAGRQRDAVGLFEVD